LSVNLSNHTTVLHVSDTHMSPDFDPGKAMWTAFVHYAEKTGSTTSGVVSVP